MRDDEIIRLQTGLELIAARSGAIVAEGAGRARKVTHKGRIDLVTETDFAVEEMLKRELAALLPGSDFLAEETASATEPGELTWIIDPVDGTTNFANGLPFVATSIALWQRNRVVLGVINLPLLGELFAARAGGGARLNGKPVSVSAEGAMEQSLIATGFPYAIDEHLDPILDRLRAVLPRVQGVRRVGAAALDLAYVACGRYEGFYESALKPWDTAAGWLLVREAGGRVTEYDTRKDYALGAGTILATNGAVHDEMSRLICGD
ncbi:inositol monophosphatase family protein [Pseudodesulfovibrio pelocollis]|uniref:inositol monophosphatase family protein n=1 Tax=Pseudodesulfovibrio pelocollis TaxID=3051432 RepID=UPI00255AA062|nr:inositol monophosphatase family protein [Pseudodesulfovibrio sp. SB368]